jgi:hypothetical protein
MMLHSSAAHRQLKEVSEQLFVIKRKLGVTDFFQYFTQRPSRAGEERGGVHITYERTEILKDHICPSVLKGLGFDFFQWKDLKPMKKGSGPLTPTL